MTTTSYIGDLFSGSSNPYSTPSYYYDTKIGNITIEEKGKAIG